MIGVYLIKCKSENKVYIGQSINIKKRYVGHLSNLRNHKHPNIYLQTDFNKYGEEDFSCEVLCELNSEDFTRKKLYELEIFYISLYDSTNRLKGYNIESGGNSYGRAAKETCEKIRQYHLGTKHSKETREKLSKIRKGKPSHLKGRKQTKEHIQKRTNVQFGKVWVNDGVMSKFVSKENASKLLKEGFVLGRPFFNRVKGKKFLYNDKMYTISQISKICGIERSVLSYRLHNGWDILKATTTPIKKQ